MVFQPANFNRQQFQQTTLKTNTTFVVRYAISRVREGFLSQYGASCCGSLRGYSAEADRHPSRPSSILSKPSSDMSFSGISATRSVLAAPAPLRRENVTAGRSHRPTVAARSAVRTKVMLKPSGVSGPTCFAPPMRKLAPFRNTRCVVYGEVLATTAPVDDALSEIYPVLPGENVTLVVVPSTFCVRAKKLLSLNTSDRALYGR